MKCRCSSLSLQAKGLAAGLILSITQSQAEPGRLPRLLVVVTGKGPQRAAYLRRLGRLDLRRYVDDVHSRSHPLKGRNERRGTLVPLNPLPRPCPLSRFS